MKSTAQNNPHVRGRLNSIGVQPRELDALLAEMGAGHTGKGSKRREYVRMPFAQASLSMRILHQGGAAMDILVACRNLSSGGMSVLHSAYLHIGSKVVIRLPNTEGHLVEMPGYVCRCAHVRGVIHEIGIRFNSQVRLRDFVKCDPFDDCFSLENVKPEQLKGSVLYVEDSEMDHTIVRHFLRETELRLVPARTPKDALRLAADPFDLILTDYDMPEMDGAKFVETLRSQGVDTPVIMLTADTSSVTRSRLTSSQVNAFLTKPLSQPVLFRAIAEFILAGKVTSGLASTLPRDHPSYCLVETFVSQCKLYAKKLLDVTERNDAETCRSLCNQIRGSAAAMGFESLGRAADEASKAVAASMDVAEAARQVRALIALCERVRN